MPYIWTDTESIQSYLSAGSRITIGTGSDEVPESAAHIFENEAVDVISTILSVAWDGVYDLTDTTVSRTLKWMAAKLAASGIAVVNIGGSLTDMPKWVSQFRSDVMGQAYRMVVNYKSTDMPDSCSLRDDLDIGEILLQVKMRSGDAVPDV